MAFDPLDEFLDDDEAGALAPRNRARKRQAPVTLRDVVVVRTSDAAVLVRGHRLTSDPFGIDDPGEELWVPRSQIERGGAVGMNALVGDRGDLLVSAWFAGQKGISGR